MGRRDRTERINIIRKNMPFHIGSLPITYKRTLNSYQKNRQRYHIKQFLVITEEQRVKEEELLRGFGNKRQYLNIVSWVHTLLTKVTLEKGMNLKVERV